MKIPDPKFKLFMGQPVVFENLSSAHLFIHEECESVENLDDCDDVGVVCCERCTKPWGTVGFTEHGYACPRCGHASMRNLNLN